MEAILWYLYHRNFMSTIWVVFWINMKCYTSGRCATREELVGERTVSNNKKTGDGIRHAGSGSNQRQRHHCVGNAECMTCNTTHTSTTQTPTSVRVPTNVHLITISAVDENINDKLCSFFRVLNTFGCLATELHNGDTIN